MAMDGVDDEMKGAMARSTGLESDPAAAVRGSPPDGGFGGDDE